MRAAMITEQKDLLHGRLSPFLYHLHIKLWSEKLQMTPAGRVQGGGLDKASVPVLLHCSPALKTETALAEKSSVSNASHNGTIRSNHSKSSIIKPKTSKGDRATYPTLTLTSPVH